MLSFKEVQKINDKIILFVEENTKIYDNFLDFIQKNKSRIKIVILGIKKRIEKGYINLLDLSNLNLEMNDSYNNPHSLLYVKEMEVIVSKFFKGHGEVSLFALLDNTILSLKNGLSLLCLGNISNTDFKEVYFIPGSLNWLRFKERFNKYKKYLRVCGFEEEIIQIEENISKFQEFYERLKSLDLNMFKKMDKKEIDLKFSYLKDIDKKFMDIKNIVDDYSNE